MNTHEQADMTAKESLNLQIANTSVLYADLKPHINSYF